MIKSELVQRISSQNPHLYQRDIEKIVSAIFDEIVEDTRRQIDPALWPHHSWWRRRGVR
jgi:nucleoid DNA-binding protein